MSITTKEFYQCGKNPDLELNEDDLIITNDYIAVIDGATSKSSITFHGHSGGWFAKDILHNCLLNLDLSSFTPATLFNYLNQCIGNAATTLYSDLAHADYPRASVILLNGFTNEIWNYGDCQCRIDDQVYTHEKYIDRLNAAMRSFTLECALLNGSSIEALKENDIGREKIKDNLKNQYLFANTNSSYGYPVLNGYSFNPDLITVHKVHPDQIVVLASDGYPVLESTLDRSEAALQRLLAEDPLCFRQYKSTRGLRNGNINFDDRTYWRGTITSLPIY